MTILQDVRFGLRMIAKQPGFAFVVILIVAVGIGLNTSVFTLVNAVLFKAPPFKNGERIVSIVFVDKREASGNGSGLSLFELDDLRQRARAFEALAASTGFSANLADGANAPERFAGSRITVNTFSLIGQAPLLGRDFLADEDRPEAAPVVLLGYGVWKNRYGSDPQVVGKTIRVSEVARTVVGVMPERFRYPSSADLWIPLVRNRNEVKRDLRNLEVIAVLKPGATVQQASADVSRVADELAAEYPDTNRNIGARAMMYVERVNGGPIRTVFIAMLGAVGFVLLVVCANVANLMLSRSIQRRKETSIRTALGASRMLLVRQLLVESVLLSAAGGVLGLGISYAGIRAFDAATLAARPYWIVFQMDPTVFVYVAVVTLVTGVVFGLAPALQASKAQLGETLKESSRGATGGRKARRLTSALVVAEVSLTLMLLAGAGMLIRSFLNMQRFDIGVNTDNLLIASMVLPDAKYPNPDQRTAFVEQLLGRLRATAGMEKTVIASNSPGQGAPSQTITLPDRSLDEVNGRKPAVVRIAIMPGYFDAFAARPIRGREFTEIDGTAGHEAVMVNERLAAQYWPGEDAIGKRMRLGDKPDAPWLTVVGVAPAFRYNVSPQSEPVPVAFIPYRQEATAAVVVLSNSRKDRASQTTAIRSGVQALDPDLPVFNIRTFEEVRYEGMWPYRVFGSVFAVFAVFALILSAMGIYAVTAHGIGQRTSEIGLRIALGASPSTVLWLVSRRSFRQLAMGLAIGLAGAAGLGQLMRSLLFQTSPTDPVTLTAIVLTLIAVTVGACIVPARRALGIDPVVALRTE